MNKDKFLELINNSVVIDTKKNIFQTSSIYKNIIKTEIEQAEREAEDTFFDDIFGIKEENNIIQFKLSPSKIKEKLGLSFFITEENFLKQKGIKKLNSQIFIFEKKNNLKDYIKCYEFFISLKEFLSEISISTNSLKKEIIIYYKEPIIIKEEIKSLKCNSFNNNQKLLNELKEKIKVEPQTRKEFIKKAIYDIFKEKIKDNDLTINDIAEKFNAIYSEFHLIERAYIDSLDTEKIKDDFKSKYQETFNFLNNIISNLYTKTLFIPIAIIFGISQRLSNLKLQHQFYIYLSLIIFLIIVGYLILGNIKVIDNIKKQIDDLKNELGDNTIFSQKLDSLYEIYKGVRNRIYVIMFLVLASLIILTFIYYPTFK